MCAKRKMRMEDVFEGEQQHESAEMLGIMDSTKIADLSSQQITKGRVTEVGREFVILDIGFKSEGRVPIAEFTDAKGELNVKVGDKIDLYIITLDSSSGDIILSKAQADMLTAWERIEKAYNDSETVTGIVVATVRAGLMVDLGGIRAFMHASQADIDYVSDLEDLVGKDVAVKILEYNKDKSNVVVSRKVILENERKEIRAKLIPMLKEGAVFEGIVKRISDFGVFVDIGGLDGLVHVSDLSWSRIKHPNEVIKLGDKLKVQVLKYNPDTEKLSLGVKQLIPDPWSLMGSKYSVGDKIKGKIVNLAEYGAFMELEPGVDGMIHISEMSWSGKIRKAEQLLKKGDLVEAVILEIDTDKKKIALGLKQIGPNPWDELKKKYPKGTRISGRIKNVTDFGIFVDVGEAFDGLVKFSDISWDTKDKNAIKNYKNDQSIETVVLDIDIERQRISLGIKQLSEDPWQSIPERYPSGRVLEGTIVKKAEFGIFVELEPTVDGLIHSSQLIEKMSKDNYKVGEKINCVVLETDVKKKKISLSVKALKEKEEKENMEAFANSQGANSKFSLGDLIKEKMKNL